MIQIFVYLTALLAVSHQSGVPHCQPQCYTDSHSNTHLSTLVGEQKRQQIIKLATAIVESLKKDENKLSGNENEHQVTLTDEVSRISFATVSPSSYNENKLTS